MIGLQRVVMLANSTKIWLTGEGTDHVHNGYHALKHTARPDWSWTTTGGSSRKTADGYLNSGCRRRERECSRRQNNGRNAYLSYLWSPERNSAAELARYQFRVWLSSCCPKFLVLEQQLLSTQRLHNCSRLPQEFTCCFNVESIMQFRPSLQLIH